MVVVRLRCEGAEALQVHLKVLGWRHQSSSATRTRRDAAARAFGGGGGSATRAHPRTATKAHRHSDNTTDKGRRAKAAAGRMHHVAHNVAIRRRPGNPFAFIVRDAQSSGTYVELGAFDGLLNANTAMFEACFNYRGLLIEANPTNFLALKAHGSKRPRSTLVHSAVCDDDSGDGIVNVTQQGGQVSGDTTEMSRYNKVRNRHHLRIHKTSTANLLGGLVAVPCRPLRTLMAKADLHAVGDDRTSADVLSLDVEGAEGIGPADSRPFCLSIRYHRDGRH